MFRYALLLCIAPVVVRAQEAGRCTVNVTVADRAGATLPAATLILTRQSSGAPPQVIKPASDTAATFSLKDLAPGDYALTATAQGRSRQTSQIHCKQGLSTLSIVLAAEAVISGRVTDEDGQPAAGARLKLLSRLYVDGEQRIWTAGETIAGADGQFRLASLPEGAYYLAATLTAAGKKNDGESYALTFYPSALAIYEAAPIHIRGPGEIGGMDVRVRRARAFSVRGRLLAGDFTENLKDFSIRLNAADPITLNLRSTPVNDKGQFEFSGVLPGVYTLIARKADANEPSARASVTVGDRDVDDLDLTLTRGMEIAGKFILEDKEHNTPSAVRITLVSRDNAEGLSSRSSGANEFQFHRVPPGNYRVLPPFAQTGFAQPLYAKALRLDGQDIPDWIVDLTAPGSHRMEIVLGSDGGRVTGYARDSSGNPRPHTMVTLAPAGSGPLTTPQFAVTATDEQGRYLFTGVQPGAYKVFAWEKVERGLVQNRGVIRQFEAQCADVVVPPNGAGNADVTVISASATAALE